jgi:glycolate oxidase
VFDSVTAATLMVTRIIAAGIVPAALELLDGVMLGALNRAFGMSFPEDAGALLLIEVDGIEEAVEEEARDLEALAAEIGAISVERARDEAERARLWKARKQAFGAVGRLTPAYLTQDGVVPRSRLPEALERIAAVARRHGLEVANVFHAGDGNLHPCLFYDPAEAGARERVLAAGEEILDVCLDLGGSITGEHGVGLEKREALARMFAPADLEAMRAIRAVFDPAGLANPGKALPWPGGCGETRTLAGRREPV